VLLLLLPLLLLESSPELLLLLSSPVLELLSAVEDSMSPVLLELLLSSPLLELSSALLLLLSSPLLLPLLLSVLLLPLLLSPLLLLPLLLLLLDSFPLLPLSSSAAVLDAVLLSGGASAVELDESPVDSPELSSTTVEASSDPVESLSAVVPSPAAWNRLRCPHRRACKTEGGGTGGGSKDAGQGSGDCSVSSNAARAKLARPPLFQSRTTRL